MSAVRDELVWIDCEMTGLDLRSDKLIEIAVLVTDGDSKVWAVENSEALKGHEGHHVKVTGHPDADKGTIHVMTVAMLDDQKAPAAKSGEMKHENKKTDSSKKSDKKS